MAAGELDLPGDDSGPDAPARLRRYGHSKDSRDDLPQIVIGLAVTREGIPVRCFVGPGNTNDQTVLTEVKDAMRDWKLGRVVTVVDRGFSSADNLAYLRRAGGHYIAGMPMRNGNALVEQVLSRQGRYQQVQDNLRVKEVRIEGTDTRFVLCHNLDQAIRYAAKRSEAVARIEAELARIADLCSSPRARFQTHSRRTTDAVTAWPGAPDPASVSSSWAVPVELCTAVEYSWTHAPCVVPWSMVKDGSWPYVPTVSVV
ncbi:MAG TPA: transposase [Actinocrinis sp.]|nr:transposase [Actinocrinis sp.]